LAVDLLEFSNGKERGIRAAKSLAAVGSIVPAVYGQCQCKSHSRVPYVGTTNCGPMEIAAVDLGGVWRLP
jgi:hypothetical protein